MSMILLASLALQAAHPSEANPQPRSCVAIVSHRGISPGMPENTLVAFRRAIDLGADAIEMDVRETADGELVVLHDPTVSRTTNGRGRVGKLTLAEVRSLDAGIHAGGRFAGERIPTYAETLQLAQASPIRLLVHVKQSRIEVIAPVLAATHRQRALDEVILGVDSLKQVHEVRKLEPRLPVLGFVPDRSSVDRFIDAGADIIRLWSHWIAENPGLVARVHARGKAVWAYMKRGRRWDVRTLEAAHERLIEARVDGIITDDPQILTSLRAGGQTARPSGDRVLCSLPTLWPDR